MLRDEETRRVVRFKPWLRTDPWRFDAWMPRAGYTPTRRDALAFCDRLLRRRRADCALAELLELELEPNVPAGEA